MRTAVAYVTDNLLCPTHGVIGKEQQKEAIRKYAEENEIHIAAWFEDEMCTEDVFARPGVLDFLDPRHGCDLVLVERVWSLSRNWAVLAPLFKEMDKRGLKIEAATMMFDGASQMTRRHFNPDMAVPPALKRLRPQVRASQETERKPSRARTTAYEVA